MEGTVETTQVVDLGMAWDLAHSEAVGRDALRALNASPRRVNALEVAWTPRGDALRRVQGEFQAFRRMVAEKLMEKAEEKRWCEEAEKFIDEELGLGEFIEKTVDVNVSFTVSVQVRGRQEPEQDAVDEACIDYVRHRLDSDDWQVSDRY
jgi:hypothetical protein